MDEEVRQVTGVGQISVCACLRASMAKTKKIGFEVKEKRAGYGKGENRKKG